MQMKTQEAAISPSAAQQEQWRRNLEEIERLLNEYVVQMKLKLEGTATTRRTT